MQHGNHNHSDVADTACSPRTKCLAESLPPLLGEGLGPREVSSHFQGPRAPAGPICLTSMSMLLTTVPQPPCGSSFIPSLTYSAHTY